MSIDWGSGKRLRPSRDLLLAIGGLDGLDQASKRADRDSGLTSSACDSQ